MSVPKHVRDEIRTRLWAQAEELDWNALGSPEKARHYQQWTDSDAIGGVLARHMDARAVRVYIKDTLLKGFGRHKLEQHRAMVLRAAGREEEAPVEVFIKPHGLRFEDDFLVAWGRADDWKVLLGALFERGYEGDAERLAVFLKAAPRFVAPSSRALVEDAALRLGVRRCVWVD